MSADIRYDNPSISPTTPVYAANAFRVIEKHYRPRKLDYKQTILLPTDYSNCLDFRNLDTETTCPDKTRVVKIADIKQQSHDNSSNDNSSNDSPYNWYVEQNYDLGDKYIESASPQVSGDGLPNGHALTPQINNNPKKKLAFLESLITNKQLKSYTNIPSTDDSMRSGGDSVSYYGIQGVPGLFVINRALSYTEQLLYSMKCWLLYDNGYTNLYNLYFRLVERGTHGDLETLPNQSDLPDDLKVNFVDDIRNLFFKTCNNVYNISENKHQQDIPTAAEPSPLFGDFSVFSPYFRQKGDSITLTPEQYNINQCYNVIPRECTSQNFHNENQYDIRALLRLRWANLGSYIYDWTIRSYTKGFSDQLDPDLRDISLKMVNPLMDHNLIYDAKNHPVRREDFEPEACIVNYYPTQQAAVIASHIDDGEPSHAPLVSFSLGCACVFLIGGKRRDEKPIHMFLNTGDCIIQSQSSRLSWHAVPRIIENSFPIYPSFIAACALLDCYYMSNDDNAFDVEEYMNKQQIPNHSPLYVSAKTLGLFKHLILTLRTKHQNDLFDRYNLSIEQIITFLLHMLCEYRLNFNTRQILDPHSDLKPEDIRKIYPIDAVKAGLYDQK